MRNTREITLVSNEAIPQHSRVKLDVDNALYVANHIPGDGLVAELATADDRCVGVCGREVMAAGESVVVVTRRGGTMRCIATGPITCGADVYAASLGKVAASGTVKEGVALESATAAGDVIEVMLGY